MGANAEACEAKNDDGKTYYVPADMTYREWEKRFVVKANLRVKAMT